MAAGGASGNLWKYMLIGGTVVAGSGIAMHLTHAGPEWLYAMLLAFGGVAVVYGACESMIKAVQGTGELLGWGKFVAGTLAGLASNVPELVMLGFIVASEPRIAFILVALTLHIGALAFGIYSALLPRGHSGHARMPPVLVKLSTDLYACAGFILLSIGSIMLAMQLFTAGEDSTVGLYASDLYVLGFGLLLVEAVYIQRMIARFSGGGSSDETRGDREGTDGSLEQDEGTGADGGGESSATWGGIATYGLVGVGASVLGGHSVGDFADILVATLESYGYSEMVGAIILSFFACAGVLAMIVTAHLKGMHDLALANVSGSVTQVPFVVLPVVMLMHAAFAQLGIVEVLPDGSVLPVDIHTSVVLVLGFPPMAILWKSIADDGKVNWVETTCMTVVFVLVLYFLGVHG